MDILDATLKLSVKQEHALMLQGRSKNAAGPDAKIATCWVWLACCICVAMFLDQIH